MFYIPSRTATLARGNHMVEITHGGSWFKWSSMDRRDRFWFVISTVASIPAGLIAGGALGRWSFRLGIELGKGEHGRDPIAPLLETELFRYGVLASFLLLAFSLFAWWRFSLRQDELFNRIQNQALGQAGAWTLGIASVWWILGLGGWVPALPLGAFVGGGYLLILVFWFRAVRQCI